MLYLFKIIQHVRHLETCVNCRFCTNKIQVLLIPSTYSPRSRTYITIFLFSLPSSNGIIFFTSDPLVLNLVLYVNFHDPKLQFDYLNRLDDHNNRFDFSIYYIPFFSCSIYFCPRSCIIFTTFDTLVLWSSYLP